MIRFSAQGAFFLLVPQRRTLIRDRALISVLRNNQMFNLRDLKLVEHVPMKISFLTFTFLQKARSENKVQASQGEWIKGTGKRTCCPWILPRQNDHPSNRQKNLKKKSFV